MASWGAACGGASTCSCFGSWCRRSKRECPALHIFILPLDCLLTEVRLAARQGFQLLSRHASGMLSNISPPTDLPDHVP